MIIPFPGRPRLIITSEIVTETRRHTAHGIYTTYYDPPILTYFLDYEDADGSCGVWDGCKYVDALVAANEWATDGIAVYDRTLEVRGRA